MSNRWNEDRIPSLDGKVAVVTGANSGLGLAASRMLARKGARVLLACRNPARGEAAADEIRGEDPRGGAACEVMQLDLASLSSVAAAAKQLRESESRLDLLVNNAGLMAIDQAKTEDGFEMQLGVNHLGHFAFTAGLAPLLLGTPGSRVVNVSSNGHRGGRLSLEDLMFERRRYDRWRPYAQSKLANILFTAELHRRLTDARASTSALAAHPGASHTDLGFEGSGITNTILKAVVAVTQSAHMGALPIVRAATDPAALSGQYYGPRFIVRGYPVVETPSRRARRADHARALWEKSEQLTGVTFDLTG